jgi:hypothetical protein
LKLREALPESTLKELAFYRMFGNNDNSFARLFFIILNVVPGSSFQRRYLYADTTTTGTKKTLRSSPYVTSIYGLDTMFWDKMRLAEIKQYESLLPLPLTRPADDFRVLQEEGNTIRPDIQSVLNGSH